MRAKGALPLIHTATMQTLLTFSINALSVLLIASIFALIFFVGV